MKRFLLFFAAAAIAAAPLLADATESTASRLQGKILLQVQQHGEAWYIDPVSKERSYISDPALLMEAIRRRGLGVSNVNLRKIPIGLAKNAVADADADGDGLADRLEDAIGTASAKGDTDGDGFGDATEIANGFDPLGTGRANADAALVNSLRGRILLQTEGNGEAWWVNPVDGLRYYLGRPAEALAAMRSFGLGISDADLAGIPEKKSGGIPERFVSDDFLRCAATTEPSTRYQNCVHNRAVAQNNPQLCLYATTDVVSTVPQRNTCVEYTALGLKNLNSDACAFIVGDDAKKARCLSLLAKYADTVRSCASQPNLNLSEECVKTVAAQQSQPDICAFAYFPTTKTACIAAAGTATGSPVSSVPLTIGIRTSKEAYVVGEAVSGGYDLAYSGPSMKVIVVYGDGRLGLSKQYYQKSLYTITSALADNIGKDTSLTAFHYGSSGGYVSGHDAFYEAGTYTYSMSVYACTDIETTLGKPDCGGDFFELKTEDLLKVTPLKTVTKNVVVR
jgi:hypothetical protein